MLERAIELKYKDFTIKKEEKNIVQEYMDKLFIAGIKFPGLYEDEQAVILETYAIDGKILEQQISKDTVTDNIVASPPSNSTKQGLFQFPEPDLVSSKVVQSEFFLLSTELKMLQENAKHISKNITPRALRIYMYRYLLSKNLISNYMSPNSGFQLEDDVCKLLAEAIAHKSENSNFDVKTMKEYNNIKEAKLKEFLPKLIEITVPY